MAHVIWFCARRRAATTDGPAVSLVKRHKRCCTGRSTTLTHAGLLEHAQVASLKSIGEAVFRGGRVRGIA